jgi:hypothetical protein
MAVIAVTDSTLWYNAVAGAKVYLLMVSRCEPAPGVLVAVRHGPG